MSWTRIGAVAAILAVAAVAFSGPVQAQQGGQRQTGNAAVAGLIDVVVQNTQALNNVNVQNNLNNLLQNSTIKVVNLNDSLNGNQTNVLSDILNESQVLSDNTVIVQNVLNNNDVAKSFLNDNNIAIDRVVAVDLLSAPVTIFVFEPR